MKVLIKKARIVYPGHDLHNKKTDILIANGKIAEIAPDIKDAKAKEIKAKDLHVSPGWLDVGTIGGEPGYEYRENFSTLSKAAAAGGFTAVALFPNSDPPMDDKAAVRFIVNNSESEIIDYYPIGAVSKSCKGEEITEMMDMYESGAVAFSDGIRSIDSNGLLLRALQYVKSINGVIIHHPDDSSISNGNLIHEGEMSTSLGLKGSPSMAEYMTVERDAYLSRYAESDLLLHNLSSAESAQRIKNMAADAVNASVSYLNLCKTDEALADFDVNYKVNPPLRSEKDRKALLQAVRKGTINIICSNHLPLEEEQKKKEFVYAGTGAIGLQTVFSALRTYAPEISLDRLVECLAVNPRKILKLPAVEIKKGQKAELSLFTTSGHWTFNEKSNYSKSKNSPFMGHEFESKIVGIVNGHSFHINNY